MKGIKWRQWEMKGAHWRTLELVCLAGARAMRTRCDRRPHANPDTSLRARMNGTNVSGYVSLFS